MISLPGQQQRSGDNRAWEAGTATPAPEADRGGLGGEAVNELCQEIWSSRRCGTAPEEAERQRERQTPRWPAQLSSAQPGRGDRRAGNVKGERGLPLTA